MWAQGSTGILALVALLACPGVTGRNYLECDDSGRLVSDDCDQVTKELHYRFRRKVVCEGMPASEDLRQRGFFNLALKSRKDCRAIASRLGHVRCDVVEFNMPDYYLVLEEQGSCIDLNKQLATLLSKRGATAVEELAQRVKSMRGTAGNTEMKTKSKRGVTAIEELAQRVKSMRVTAGHTEMKKSAEHDRADAQPADDGAMDDGAADDQPLPMADPADDEGPVGTDDELADDKAVEDDPPGQDEPGAVSRPADGAKSSKIFSAMKEGPHEFPMEQTFAIIGVIAVILGIGLLLREQILFWYRRYNKEPSSFL